MKRRLERLGFEQDTLITLQQVGISTAGSFYECSLLQLMAILDIDRNEARELLRSTAARINIACASAAQLLHSVSFLPSGLQELDIALGGGIQVGALTEIVGVPGIGKTQLCIGCCVYTLVMQHSAGAQGTVIYIDTELKFDASRAVEIAGAAFPQLFPATDLNFTEYSGLMRSLLDAIQVYRPTSCAELLQLIETLQSSIIENKCRLIVIDSVAALVRRERLNEDDKETYLVRQSNLLKRLAETCGCAVLLTNQVCSPVSVVMLASDT